MLKSIYSYDDYRAYLRDVYERRKRDEGLTFESFARKAGLRARNALKLVMEGKRNLTSDSLHRFARALGLNPDETAFFETLVWMSQSEDAKTRAYYQARLSALRAEKPQGLRERKADLLLGHWRYPAAMLAVHGFAEAEAAERLERLLGLGRTAASRTLQDLLAAGELVRRDERLWARDVNSEVRDRRKTNAAAQAYLRSQLALSQGAFEKSYRKRGKFMSQTFTASASKLASYRGLVDSFLDGLLALSEDDPAEEVVQVNVQLFPIREAW